MAGCQWDEMLTTVNMDYNVDGFYDYYTEEGCASMLTSNAIAFRISIITTIIL